MVAQRFLPALRRPVGAGAQLTALQQQNTAMQQALVAQAATTAPTLARKKPNLLVQLLRLTGAANEAALPPFWAHFVTLKAGECLGALMGCTGREAQRRGMPQPMLSPALASDVGSGLFASANVNDVTEGLSILRLQTQASPRRDELTNRNRVHMTMAGGTGLGQVDAVQLVLANNEIEPPTSSEQFRAYIQGYYVLLMVLLGNVPLVQEHETELIDQLGVLIGQLETFIPEEPRRHYVFLQTLVFIFRVMNGCMNNVLMAPMPPGLPPGAPGPAPPAAAILPPFGQIAEHLMMGRIETLTTLPPDLMQRVVPPPLPPAAGPPSRPPGGGTPGPAPPSGPARARVERPNQNRNLKNAWSAAGHPAVFGPSSPFYDASLPNNRKIVPSDTPNKRICLPMSLTGVCYSNCGGKHDTLSDAEVQRVAEVGCLVIS